MEHENVASAETVGTAQRPLSFGEAVAALKEGKMLMREGWNGKHLFVFMQVPAMVPGNIVPKMSSLPDLVKEEFAKRDVLGVSGLKYKNQFAIVDAENNIQGWIASSGDVLGIDWYIYKS